MKAAVAIEAAQDARGAEIAQIRLDCAIDLAGQRARAVIASHPVVVTALVGQRVVVAVGVPTRADLKIEHEVFRNARGADVHVAAAEPGRHVGGESLVDRQRLDDLGRKEIERNDVARQVGRRNVCTVDRRARVTLAQPADVDELIADERDAGEPAQRQRHSAVADSADLLCADQVDDDFLFDPLLHDIGRSRALPADDDDLFGRPAAHLRRPVFLSDRVAGRQQISSRQRQRQADGFSDSSLH
jgi:hypothetical protein